MLPLSKTTSQESAACNAYAPKTTPLITNRSRSSAYSLMGPDLEPQSVALTPQQAADKLKLFYTYKLYSSDDHAVVNTILLRPDILAIAACYRGPNDPPDRLRQHIAQLASPQNIARTLTHYDQRIIHQRHQGDLTGFLQQRLASWFQHPLLSRFDLFLQPMQAAASDLEFLTNYEYLAALRAGIQSTIDAKKANPVKPQFIHIAMHEILDGHLARAMIAHLTLAASLGVEVRIVTCAIGSHQISDGQVTKGGDLIHLAHRIVNKLVSPSTADLLEGATSGAPDFNALKQAGGEVAVIGPLRGRIFDEGLFRSLFECPDDRGPRVELNGIHHLKFAHFSAGGGRQSLRQKNKGLIFLGGGTICDQAAYSVKTRDAISQLGKKYPRDKLGYPKVPANDTPVTHDSLLKVTGHHHAAMGFYAMWALAGGSLPTADLEARERYLPRDFEMTATPPTSDGDRLTTFFGIPACIDNPLNRALFRFVEKDPDAPLYICNYMIHSPGFWQALSKRRGPVTMIISGHHLRSIDATMQAAILVQIAAFKSKSGCTLNVMIHPSFVHGKILIRPSSAPTGLGHLLVTTGNYDQLTGEPERSAAMYDLTVEVEASRATTHQALTKFMAEFNKEGGIRVTDDYLATITEAQQKAGMDNISQVAKLTAIIHLAREWLF